MLSSTENVTVGLTDDTNNASLSVTFPPLGNYSADYSLAGSDIAGFLTFKKSNSFLLRISKSKLNRFGNLQRFWLLFNSFLPKWHSSYQCTIRNSCCLEIERIRRFCQLPTFPLQHHFDVLGRRRYRLVIVTLLTEIIS